jgi:hypothetical protein
MTNPASSDKPTPSLSAEVVERSMIQPSHSELHLTVSTAQALVFSALVTLGGWLLALVYVWHMSWVIPASLYGALWYFAWENFFVGTTSVLEDTALDYRTKRILDRIAITSGISEEALRKALEKASQDVRAGGLGSGF